MSRKWRNSERACSIRGEKIPPYLIPGLKIKFATILSFVLLSSLLLPTVLQVSAGSSPETHDRALKRRALLIGISTYNQEETNRSFPNLPPVRNDLRAMEILLSSPPYDFEILKLQDEEATRERILLEINRFLIDGAESGDVSVLYFSGHGSQVINSLGGEIDGKDESLVPYDVIRPVTKRSELKDIRDKELDELFSKAASKGIKITAIFDSCHSGSIGKDPEQVRQLEPANFDVKEAPRTPSRGTPSSGSILVLSASKDYQRASSGQYGLNPIFRRMGFDEAESLGHLTANLIFALYTSPAETITAGNLFNRIEGRMRAQGISQRPDLDAAPERRKQTLFGEKVGRAVTWLPVEADKRNDLFLLGGIANGLLPGSEFVQVKEGKAPEGESPLTIRLTDVELTKSKFKVLPDHSISEINPGDLFEQVTWGAAAESQLDVWLPPAKYRSDDIEKLALAVEIFARDKGLKLSDDPLDPEAGYRVYLGGTDLKPEWRLILPTGGENAIGKDLTAKNLTKAFRGIEIDNGNRMFVEYPPPQEMSKELGYAFEPENLPIRRVRGRSAANYLLVGRTSAKGAVRTMEYSWVLEEAIQSGLDEFGEENPTALPVISRWVSANDVKGAVEKIQTLSKRLARIRGWLKLSPPAGSSAKFPYRLEIRTAQGKPMSEEKPLLVGRKYFLYLSVDPEEYKSPSSRMKRTFHWYIIAIDRNGAMTHLTRNNHKPINVDSPQGGPEILLFDIEFEPPVGTENFILLMTAEPLSDPTVLDSEGVRNESTKAISDPLSMLLNDLSEPDLKGSTKGGLSTPDTWFVQQITRLSAEP